MSMTKGCIYCYNFSSRLVGGVRFLRQYAHLARALEYDLRYLAHILISVYAYLRLDVLLRKPCFDKVFADIRTFFVKDYRVAVEEYAKASAFYFCIDTHKTGNRRKRCWMTVAEMLCVHRITKQNRNHHIGCRDALPATTKARCALRPIPLRVTKKRSRCESVCFSFLIIIFIIKKEC